MYKKVEKQLQLAAIFGIVTLCTYLEPYGLFLLVLQQSWRCDQCQTKPNPTVQVDSTENRSGCRSVSTDIQSWMFIQNNFQQQICWIVPTSDDYFGRAWERFRKSTVTGLTVPAPALSRCSELWLSHLVVGGMSQTSHTPLRLSQICPAFYGSIAMPRKPVGIVESDLS